MILCIGSASDRTFVHTLRALEQARVEFEPIDIGQLVYSGDVHIPLDDVSAATITLHGRKYVVGSYESGVIRIFDISDAAPNERLAHRAAALNMALCRLFDAAPFPIINPPLGGDSNYAKLFHAHAIAGLTNWRVPRSCQTNRPDDARAFIASCGEGVIFKGSSSQKTWATLYDAAEHERRLPLLAASSVLFQECIAGPDVRVHVVEDRLFAELISARDEIDYRIASQRRFRAIRVPEDVQRGCAILRRELGIPFIGVDFKIQRSTGAWFFLEANPQPGYDWYDRRANGAISRALVEWLTARSRRAHRAASAKG
jgi:glutathione synthase/RimK-type ligase-like ATP-grasp enzyme